MIDSNDVLALEIKNLISSDFINAGIDVTVDKKQNEYYFSTRNKELYYSDAFQQLIMDIKMNILWKNNIYNFYFVLDQREYITSQITFLLTKENVFNIWKISKPISFASENNSADNLSMAA